MTDRPTTPSNTDPLLLAHAAAMARLIHLAEKFGWDEANGPEDVFVFLEQQLQKARSIDALPENAVKPEDAALIASDPAIHDWAKQNSQGSSQKSAKRPAGMRRPG